MKALAAPYIEVPAVVVVDQRGGSGPITMSGGGRVCIFHEPINNFMML